LCVTNAAKTLEIQPKAFFQWLSEHQWIYRRAGGSSWVAYQGRIQSGHLEHKITTVERSDGSQKVVEQVLITPKGLARLAELLTSLRSLASASAN
jgi:phage antirepressor YoqD-like protein